VGGLDSTRIHGTSVLVEGARPQHQKRLNAPQQKPAYSIIWSARASSVAGTSRVFAERKVMEDPAMSADQSGLMPANFTTLAHF
jgi:hypothetical protein